ncbi:MAG: ATPase, T2SS/T4P/T4SS family, partial [Pirellulaceae bacterium]
MEIIETHDRSAHPELAPRFMHILTEGASDGTAAAGLAKEETAGPALALALMSDAVQRGATDVHIDPCDEYDLVRFRIDGTLANAVSMPPAAGRRLINQFRVLCKVDPTDLEVQDGNWAGDLAGREMHIRATFVPTVYGEKMAARILDRSLSHMHLNEIGLSDDAIEIIDRHIHSLSGLIMATGPTGSGKTVTLFSMLNEIDLETHSVVTLEDPVEYQNPVFTQIAVSESTGINFENGIGTLLRLDPDYLLIGETRDPRTAKAMVRAAGSGRAVLTTAHAEDAEGVVDSLRSWSLENREIASALRLVIGQRLVRTLCPHCSIRGKPSDSDQRWARSCGVKLPARVPQAMGCDECYGLGYRGRTGLFQVWELSESEIDQIGSGVPARTIRASRHKAGIPTMAQIAMEKVQQEGTTVAELRRASLPC